MKDKETKFGIRKVSPKKIVKAGLTLGVGFLVLPFIPFKKARYFEPFKNMKERKGGKK